MSVVLQQALFPGDSELQQLLHIFKFLGTPDEAVWPGVSKLRDWHEFPNWKAQEMTRAFPSLDQAGIELMKGMFVYDPVKRMSVSTLYVMSLQMVVTMYHDAHGYCLHGVLSYIAFLHVDYLHVESTYLITVVCFFFFFQASLCSLSTCG